MFDITTSIDLSKLEPLNKEGKNSSVFSYFDEQLGKKFVVKVIENETAYKQYGSEYIDNLFAESKILYANKHPNIVEIQYASYDNDNVYISMPEYKNGSLNSIINNRFLTVREIIKYSLEFLSGLHFIHTNDLIHFDIKPTNILIDDNGKAVLTDFGLAKYINKFGLASPDMIYNTHKPPEFFINREMTNKSDIYQVGVTMYRLCNGNLCFKDQITNSKDYQNDILKGNFPNRKFYLPHIPIKLQNIINKAMNIDPDKRYQTVLDMINKLSVIEDNLDWIYCVQNNKEIWQKVNDKGTHKICIYLCLNGNNKYDLKVEKVNISTGRATVNNDYPACDYSNMTYKDAYKSVAQITKTC